MRYLQIHRIRGSGLPLKLRLWYLGAPCNGFLIKAFWEKLDALGIMLEVKWGGMPLPQRGDKAIMHMMVEMGLRGKELLRVNRVRKAQETFFLSDMTTANGKCLEQHLLDGHWIEFDERQLGAHRLKLL